MTGKITLHQFRLSLFDYLFYELLIHNVGQPKMGKNKKNNGHFKTLLKNRVMKNFEERDGLLVPKSAKRWVFFLSRFSRITFYRIFCNFRSAVLLTHPYLAIVRYCSLNIKPVFLQKKIYVYLNWRSAYFVWFYHQSVV